MSFEDKRILLEKAFSGKDSEGKRLGVYITQDENQNLSYTINGIIKNETQPLPFPHETKGSITEIKGKLPNIEQSAKQPAKKKSHKKKGIHNILSTD